MEIKMKLFDSERKVMEVLWREGGISAGQVVKILKEETGWNKNTTYTVIKKCVDKGAVKREEPGFICRPLISRQEVQDYETEELIDKMFDGSKEKFFAAFLDGKKLSNQEVDSLKRMIDDLSQERRLE
jgi:BlaI family penicillinase repressor